MIIGYNAPGSRIQIQAKRVTSTSVSSRYAFIVGPRYRVQRFAEGSVLNETLSGSSQLMPFEYTEDSGLAVTKDAAWTIDEAFTRLFVEAMDVSLATFLSSHANKVRILSSTESNVLRLLNNATFSGTGLDTRLNGRAVQIGDVVLVNDGTRTLRRKVLGLRGVAVASSKGSNSTFDDDLVANAVTNPLDQNTQQLTVVSKPAGMGSNPTISGTYNGLALGSTIDGRYGDEWTLVCTTAGAAGTSVFSIESTNGLSATGVASVAGAGSVHEITHSTLGGLTVTLPAGALALNDTVVLKVYGAYTRDPSDYVLVAGTYSGSQPTRFIATVTTGIKGSGSTEFNGAVVRIADTQGLITPFDATVTTDTAINIGLGLTLTFNNGTLPDHAGLRKGDIFWFEAVPESESITAYDKLVLDGPAVNLVSFSPATDIPSVEFRLTYSGEILQTDAISGNAWTQDSSGVTVAAGLALQVTSRSTNQWCPFVASTGELGITWRALIPPSDETPYVLIPDTGTVVSELGPISTDNTLAFGAIEALKGGGSIYAVPVDSDDATGYATALGRIGELNIVGTIALLSNDPEVRSVGRAHVLANASDTRQRWRKLYVGIDAPDRWTRLSTRSDDVTSLTATVEPYLDLGNVLVSAVGADFTGANVAAGDVVSFTLSGVEATISQVLSATELLLTAPLATPIDPAQPITILAAATPANKITYTKAQLAALGNTNVSALWHDSGNRLSEDALTNVTIPAYYTAAWVAAARMFELPQQGFTRKQVPTITSAPALYTRYTTEQLNDLAAHGCMIVTQESAGGEVFIRHQLTTDTENGALFSEDNIMMIAYDIAYAHKTLINASIGRRNMTERSLAAIRDQLLRDAEGRTRSDRGNADLGPQLVSFANISVEAHPTLKDTVVSGGEYNVALPINGQVHTIYLSVASTATTTAV